MSCLKIVFRQSLVESFDPEILFIVFYQVLNDVIRYRIGVSIVRKKNPVVFAIEPDEPGAAANP